jgi:hypothetical protein
MAARYVKMAALSTNSIRVAVNGGYLWYNLCVLLWAGVEVWCALKLCGEKALVVAVNLQPCR